MAYAKEIVKYAKSKDLKLAIVTSSIKEKILFLQNKYPGVFDADVIVTSEEY
jgi:phosphoserine phosphatase